LRDDRVDLRAAAGWADLARLLRDGDAPTAAAFARHLGLQRVVEAQREAADTAPASPTEPFEPSTPQALPEQPAKKAPTAHIWRVVETEQRDVPVDEPLPPLAPLPEEGGDVLARPATPELCPWRAVWPRIYDLIAQTVAGRAVDVPVLIGEVARARPLVRVPRRAWRRWPERLTLWVDRHIDVAPLWDDQDALRTRLARWCPQVDVRFHRTDFVPRPGETALLLGDLTALGRQAQRLGRRAEARGAHLAALTARPAQVRGWKTALWHDSKAREGTTEQRADRLLALAGTVPWVPRGLLRALRLTLPARLADVTTELDVWQHSALRAQASDGIVIEPAAARGRALPAEARRQAAYQAVAAWYGGLPASARHLAALRWPGLDGPFDVALATAHFERFKQHVLGGRAPELVHYARLASDQLVSAMDHHPELKELVNLLWHAGHPGAVEVVPEGIDPALAHRVRPGAAMEWHLLHAEGGLRLAPQPRGVVLARVRSTQPVAWVRLGEQRRQQRLDTPIDLAQATRIELATDLSTVVLEKLERPAWAVAFGVERGRAWAEAELDGATRRLWADGAGWAGEGGYGADGFGVFHVTEVKGQRLQMRLIPAGEFLMGSPKNDREGFDDERPQHLVRLTQSFWLAEVPVTQALWQAVMGYNPAHFKGLDRPVEKVSWDDAQYFIGKLASLRPGPWRLPTEAQWEYACRAGTTTPRYGALNEVAWWDGNSENETRPVGQKRANAWGLHDMLGNVLEWCADYGLSRYPNTPETDPCGPGSGSYRVFRGGCWLFTAGSVRAANRNADLTALSKDFLGFRLSRGLALQSAARSAGRAIEQQRAEVATPKVPIAVPPAPEPPAPPKTVPKAPPTKPEPPKPEPSKPEPPKPEPPKPGFWSRLFGRTKPPGEDP
jgi:formylglycine-generating enzyme required for sulfatase activity